MAMISTPVVGGGIAGLPLAREPAIHGAAGPVLATGECMKTW